MKVTKKKKLIENIRYVLKEKVKELLISLLNKEDCRYLTRTEAAKLLNISVTTLWRLDRKQTLPATRFYGRVLYLKSDLLNYLE
jgi:excisionase family DNA binding protein